MLIPLIVVPVISERLLTDPPRSLSSPLKSHVISVGPGEMIRLLMESSTIADIQVSSVEEQKEEEKYSAALRTDA